MEKKVYLITPEGKTPLTHITSDTHIGHKNIAKYTGRPYDNERGTFHMDNDLVNHWNSVVPVDGQVLHLGDAALGQITDSIKYYGAMNGTKYLVPGNHDYISSVSTKSRQGRYKLVYDEYFIVLDETVMLEVVRGGESRSVRACHYPSSGDEREGDRYDRLRPLADGVPLIHGHTHRHEVFNPARPLEYHVGIDAHGLKPVSAESIVDWVFGL